VGFIQNLLQGRQLVPSIVTPYSTGSTSLIQLVAADLFPDVTTKTVDRAAALKIPGVKRAHSIHTGLVGGLSFFQYTGDTRRDDQPEWLTNSASGVPIYQRWAGICSDLFFDAWACLALSDDGTDAIHVPSGLWTIDSETGDVVIDERIPTEYRHNPRIITMGYGDNGFLVDARETILASTDLARIWMERLENPSPGTELHITDPAFDHMSHEDKIKLVDQWNSNRQRSGGQTAVTPSFIKVNALGQNSADLFEKGRNAIRLDLANHAAVPASIIEGSKDGGGGDMSYSNDTSERNELFDFGTSRFVRAIEARLSLDDVVESGDSIRADLGNLMASPTPVMNQTSKD